MVGITRSRVIFFIASSIIGRGLLDDALSKDVSLVAAVGQQTWLGNIKKIWHKKQVDPPEIANLVNITRSTMLFLGIVDLYLVNGVCTCKCCNL